MLNLKLCDGQLNGRQYLDLNGMASNWDLSASQHVILMVLTNVIVYSEPSKRGISFFSDICSQSFCLQTSLRGKQTNPVLCLTYWESQSVTPQPLGGPSIYSQERCLPWFSFKIGFPDDCQSESNKMKEAWGNHGLSRSRFIDWDISTFFLTQLFICF